ncbi:MAG: hypothetical protein U9O83_02820 [Campylobacterota bacterium]|nr:hypothetical protein [Campylobacterota bacterium]
MTVLTIIGILTAAGALYWFISEVNGFTNTLYRYSIFNMSNYFSSVVAYAMIYGGSIVYNKAISSGGDVLNGQLLIVMGVIILISIFIYNVNRTSLVLGSILSIIQTLIYAPLATLGLFVFIVAIAYFSQTKPVYNINS